MTFLEEHRLDVDHTEQALLKVSWEGEIFGVGVFETLAEKFREYADVLTASATMEWLNAHLCEDFGHAAGIHVGLAEAEKLGRAGQAFARDSGSFDTMAHLMIGITTSADPLFEELAKGAKTPELAQLGKDLLAHENALRDLMRAELAGDTDAGAEVFSYLERHGISREEAVIPRNRREDLGGDQQRLVLASFPDEAAADKAAASLKSWEKSGDDLKVDGIGVLVADENGMVEEHKLGRTAGKKGMGIGVALGLVAAIPTAGLSLVAGAVGGAVGGGIIGHFFHKGLALSDEQAAHIAEELDAGGAIVGALTWDFQTKVVADKLVELGGTARSIDVAPVAA